jgi:hypothetical protein
MLQIFLCLHIVFFEGSTNFQFLCTKAPLQNYWYSRDLTSFVTSHSLWESRMETTRQVLLEMDTDAKIVEKVKFLNEKQIKPLQIFDEKNTAAEHLQISSVDDGVLFLEVDYISHLQNCYYDETKNQCFKKELGMATNHIGGKKDYTAYLEYYLSKLQRYL